MERALSRSGPDDALAGAGRGADAPGGRGPGETAAGETGAAATPTDSAEPAGRAVPATPATLTEPATPTEPVASALSVASATPVEPAAPRDPGLYGPASEAWRLNREAMLLLGAGPRALLLQLAHPSVAAGVADHSDFRADPWRRLRGTLRSYLAIVYGTREAARAEIRRLNTLHRDITGPGYRARDPVLSLWVHATLIDSTLAATEAWLERLPRDRAEAFYEETRPIGRAFGIPESMLPDDLDAFEAYVVEQLSPGGPVVVGPLARELAATVLHPPLPGVLGRLGVPTAAYDWTMWPAVGLLPPAVREAYGLPWGPRERAVSAWLVTTWRAWRPLLPRTFRQMPQALAADRRMASG